MDFRAEYEKWCTDTYFDEATKAELKAIAGDDKEIEDRFYRTNGKNAPAKRKKIFLISK